MVGFDNGFPFFLFFHGRIDAGVDVGVCVCVSLGNVFPTTCY